MNEGITAVILNWKRPYNLIDYILPTIVKCHLIREIIISHGRSDSKFQWKSSRDIPIIHRDDTELNSTYGLSLRFLAASNAKYQNILLVDDDEIPHPATIINMFKIYKRQSPCIIGKYGRYVDNNLRYSSNSIPSQATEAPIILTSLMLFPKHLVNSFFRESSKILPWVQEESSPLWNGEDIVLSLLALVKFNKWGVVVNSDTFFPSKSIRTEDDHKIAISHQPGHVPYRSLLIKKCQRVFGIGGKCLKYPI